MVVGVTPIAKALSTLPDEERKQLHHKFDVHVAYFLALEKLSFRKYPHLCELEVCHGVATGTMYANIIDVKTFTHYIHVHVHCSRVMSQATAGKACSGQVLHAVN